MIIQPPAAGEYNPYYHEYIRRVPAGDVLAFLETQVRSTLALLQGLSDEQASARPGPDEWNIKEIVGHLSDSERIFAYRALRFGRGDETELPGFYQNPYVENGHFAERTLADLLDEFATVRKANLYLFRNLTITDSERSAIASGSPMSVRALIYAIAGHEHHHVESIRTVYLGMTD
ncbi:MAG: DinB family protein [Caldilinea sp. CFX5]|nr:DinB family protein [Caldilinea sp. CFX5]